MRRLNSLQEELAAFDIRIIALSTDTRKEAAIHKKRDSLEFTLLADPNHEVIRTYGVEHHKALHFTTSAWKIGGIPIVFRPSFQTMAIPTTLLVDASGTIQWIDQADDYRIRASSERVLTAVRAAFN